MTAPIAKLSQLCLTKMFFNYNVTQYVTTVPVIRSQLLIILILHHHVQSEIDVLLQSILPLIHSLLIHGTNLMYLLACELKLHSMDLMKASIAFINCLQQEYTRILTMKVTTDYLKSMTMCLITVYLLANLGRRIAKTKIFKAATNTTSILLSRLIDMMENARYRWCLRHPIRSSRIKRRRLKFNRMALYRYYKGKPKLRHKDYKFNPYNMHHWSNLPEEIIDAKVALAAASDQNGIRFHPDTDHMEVGIDTQCSRSICNNKEMIRNATICNVRIRGLGGIIVRATIQGDWILPITSDDGRTTIQVVPNTVLCEQAGKSLLSPQHFFQKYLPGSIGRLKGKEITTAETTTFIYGNKGEFKCTIPITKANANVPVLKTKPSLDSLHSYMAHNHTLVEDIMCHECTTFTQQTDLPIVSDDEDSVNTN